MAAALAEPGVEVLQVFRTTSPTIIVPTLVPCVIGVCRQVVSALSKTSSGSSALNGDALVSLPALLLAKAAPGSPPKYTGFDGIGFSLSINNSPEVSLVFEDPTSAGLSPLSLATQIAKQFLAAGVTAAVAETVGTSQWRLRTVGVGEFQSILITGGDPAVLSALGIAVGQEFVGLGAYRQRDVRIHQSNLPDPRRNLGLLAVEAETIRAFLGMGSGSGLLELKRTESFLRRGGATSAAQLIGTVDITGLSFATRAVVTGTTDVTAGALYGGGGTLNGLTLKLNVNSGGLQTLNLNGNTNAANQAALLAAIIALWPALAATVGGPSSNKLVLTDSVYGPPGTIVIDGTSTALLALGLSAGTTPGTAGALGNSTTTFATDGAANVTVNWNYPHNVTTLLSQINGTTDIALTASQGGPGGNKLVLTSPTAGNLSSVKAVSGTGGTIAALGFTNGQIDYGEAAIAAVDDGNGDALTPLIKLNGADLTAPGAAAAVTGTEDVTALTLTGETLILSDGGPPQKFTFENDGSTSTDDELTDFFGPPAGGKITATLDGSNHLVLTSSDKGEESVVEIVGGTAVTLLGLTTGKTRGTGFPPQAGDQLYVDGVAYGQITQVAPGGVTDTVKINRQVPIKDKIGSTWYVVAKNLAGAQTATRPSADLLVDGNGNLLLKHEVLRDTTGAPVDAKAPIYVSYRAVRQDVTPRARKGLLSFNSTDAVAASLDPINTDNPLALGLYFALLNAPGIQVTGIGVDSTTADAPYGTVEAFTRVATFLEAFEVYALAPLTNDEGVAQVFNAHASAMSSPAQKGERVVLFNPAQPTARDDTTVASGLHGNSTSSTSFDTEVVNLAALLLAQGIDPTGTIAASDGVFLDIASDSKRYSIESVSGGLVNIRTVFDPGDNDDGFYATTDLATAPLPASLIDEAFAIRIRGATLTLPDGTLDKQAMAETYQAQAIGYGNRRFWRIIADKVGATLDGLEQLLPGFYLCAAYAGAVGQQPPQTSFTRFPLTGFTQVQGTQGFFTNGQLNIIQGGGNWPVIQEAEGTPLIGRFALTSDVTSLETRTDSVTKVVDFAAKFLRRGLRNFIGRFNVTQGFLDALSHVIQGLLGFLTETGVLIGADLNNIIQDETAPDTVLVDVTLDVPFPCNYIRLTLAV